MSSMVITIPDGEGVPPKEKTRSKFSFMVPLISFVKENQSKLMHSFKVGIALVLVSLLCLLDPLYKQVGDNAMWAIMTVVVIFEFFAGATLSKGLNRGIGTILGGLLGCLAAALAQEVGGIGDAIVVAMSIFIFGAAATYSRLVPNIKKRYDYAAMIFILTFNLVVVSGIRAEKVLHLALERLTTIFIGFCVCIFISLLIFPIWAGDDLHNSIVSRFNDLATTIEGCLNEYFRYAGEKESQSSVKFGSCREVLQSKLKDESLANFARWEPWHGRFGFFHPWHKYVKIGELLRDLATAILALKPCLQSPKEEASESLRYSVKESCGSVGDSLTWTLKELRESISKMRRCQATDIITPKLKAMRQELSLMTLKIGQVEVNREAFAAMSFLFSLEEMVNKVEELAKEVDELGKLAGFHDK